MPSDFDDGLPDRSFLGRGIVDQGEALANVNFEVGHVPNTAGYFGHVDPELAVVYEGPRFMVSFPILAELLAGPTDWMSYDLAALAERKMLRLGIGQLREVGLSDPRFAVGLLAGATGDLLPLVPSPGSNPSLHAHSTTVSVAMAAAEAGEDLGPVLDQLIALGVSSLDVDLDIDSANRIGRFAYSLSYPPRVGSRAVRLRVMMEFPKYGVDEDLQAPEPPSVVMIEDYLSL